jgi:hypothetical protein
MRMLRQTCGLRDPGCMMGVVGLPVGAASSQVVSLFSSFGFKWPVQLTKLFTSSSMSTFNEQLMAPECSIGEWSFELKCVHGGSRFAGPSSPPAPACPWPSVLCVPRSRSVP